MRIYCLKHVPYEGAGAIGDWARDRGHAMTEVDLWAGAALPDIDDLDALVVMGGPMSIYDYEDCPFLRGEKHFIAQALEAGRKVLGICLGAQLLSHVLGGRCQPHTGKEIGWQPVTFTEEGRALFPALPAELSVLHWHGDTYSLPVGAVRLASTDFCREQGFYWKSLALGLQFHFEMTEQGVRKLIAASPAILFDEPGYVHPPERIVEDTIALENNAREVLYKLLDQFFEADKGN